MHDAIVISDLHLGFAGSQTERLAAFLGELPETKSLVLNGDVIHSSSARLTRRDWKVLSAIRRLSDRVRVVWVAGNHDHDCEAIAHVVGADFYPGWVVQTGAKRLLCMHGHAWDSFIATRPFATWVADKAHLAIQAVSPTLAVFTKRNTKAFLRNCERVKAGAVGYAAGYGDWYFAVVCGHTHHAEAPDGAGDGIAYANSGCWTEPVCHYLAVRDGSVELKEVAA